MQFVCRLRGCLDFAFRSIVAVVVESVKSQCREFDLDSCSDEHSGSFVRFSFRHLLPVFGRLIEIGDECARWKHGMTLL